MKTTTAWDGVRSHRYAKLRSNSRFDVVVIGGGLTGLTAAYLLKKAGKTVCVLERDRLGSGDTGRTTAHLTAVTDRRISALVKSFGKETARVVWQAGTAAINTIEAISAAEEIDCEFRRIPGYLHASLTGPGDESRDLRSEADAARGLGIDATYLSEIPRLGLPGIRYSNQAKFHPLRYLQGLGQAIAGEGSEIHETSEVSEVEAKPLAVKVGKLRVECDYLVIATHVPLMGIAGLVGAALFQSKLIPYSSYAISARLPKGDFPEASFWDTSNPYYYLRIDPAKNYDQAIFGGEDHKTGQAENTAARFKRLEGLLKQLSPKCKIEDGWSGQVIETIDGLPYIGETADHQFVATGFAGNGMTFGTLAGMMACDQALGRHNPWRDVFDVNRKKIRDGAWKFIRENLDYPYYLLRDRFRSSQAPSARAVKRGEGKIIDVDGQRVACSRDPQGKLHQVSAVCTHLGCIVHWNQAEETWDCPCHGSRFRRTGEVLAGPAESPLEPIAAEKPRRPQAKPAAANGRNGKRPHRRSAAPGTSRRSAARRSG